MKKLRIHVQGRVQGVGFRYTTKMLADQLGVTGSVKNEADGSVSIEAIGDDKAIDAFVAGVKDSPSPAGMGTCACNASCTKCQPSIK